MIKTAKFFLLLALVFGELSGVWARERHSTLQVTLFPPLGTNGREAKDYTNDISLNLLVGVSRNERALALAGVAGIVHGDARGVQFAGVLGAVGNDARGVQFAGLANAVGNDGAGVQFGGVTNMVGGEFTGVQFGGLGNMTGSLEGIQFGGVGNIAGNVRGIQFGGWGNIAGKIEGIQFGGLGNVAGKVEGAQIGGLLNVAGTVRGTQVGVVNVARHNDVPIGLVNLIRDGEMGVAITYNDLGTLGATFRSGGRVTYGILGLGCNTRFRGTWSVVGGIGAHIPVVSRL
ncbi:MAG: hypothetical protein LBU97_00250, partial [Alistipes sp.]|nr:hypothetical protein [Alistipes sp.]